VAGPPPGRREGAQASNRPKAELIFHNC